MSDFLDEIHEDEQATTAPGMLRAIVRAILSWRRPVPTPILDWEAQRTADADVAVLRALRAARKPPTS